MTLEILAIQIPLLIVSRCPSFRGTSKLGMRSVAVQFLRTDQPGIGRIGNLKEISEYVQCRTKCGLALHLAQPR